MRVKRKFAFLIYAANILIMLGIGMAFEFSSEFMPFHADVIQTDWNDVGEHSKILYLGMMRTEGAGFLASAAALAILLLHPFRKKENWSAWAMTAIGLIEYLPSLLANYHVATVTNASPPWILMLTLSLSLILALYFSSPCRRDIVEPSLPG